MASGVESTSSVNCHIRYIVTGGTCICIAIRTECELKVKHPTERNTYIYYVYVR